MPDANIVFEGSVRVFSTNQKGEPYTIKKGKRAGQDYSRLSFTKDGETIYLADFGNDALKAGIVDGSTAKVAYSLKLDDFGEPDLYNGNNQYQLEAIKLTGEPQTPKTAAPTSGASTTGSKPACDPELSAKQTAANDATRIIAARGVPLEGGTTEWTTWADHILAWLTGVDELDAALAKSKAEGFVEEEIAFEKGPDDDNFPF